MCATSWGDFINPLYHQWVQIQPVNNVTFQSEWDLVILIGMVE